MLLDLQSKSDLPQYQSKIAGCCLCHLVCHNASPAFAHPAYLLPVTLSPFSRRTDGVSDAAISGLCFPNFGNSGCAGNLPPRHPTPPKRFRLLFPHHADMDLGRFHRRPCLPAMIFSSMLAAPTSWSQSYHNISWKPFPPSLPHLLPRCHLRLHHFRSLPEL